MKRGGRTIWAVLGALLVIGVGWWWTMARAREEAVAALGVAAHERRELDAALQKTRERLERAERNRADAAEALVKARASGAAAAGPKPAAPRSLRKMSEIISSSPVLEAVELERQRAAVNQEYDRFFRQLGLSPEQQAKFRELQAKREETAMDLRAVARKQDEAGQRTAEDLQAKAKAEHEVAQRALLGPEGYAKLEEFNRSVPVYNMVVRGLGGAAALEGIPLTPEQGERLLAATVSITGGTTPLGDLDPRTIDWDALDRQAQQILTPQQFALFKTVDAPSGFQGRWRFQLEAAMQRALDAERAGKK